MNKLTFSGISANEKKAYQQVIRDWARTGHSVEVLKEGLSMLSSKHRENAIELCNDECLAASFIITYGKRNKPKLSLDQGEAGKMLAFVEKIRDIAQDEELAKRMIEAASSALFEGQKPMTLFDPSWKPLLKLLVSVGSDVRQGVLF